MTSAGMDTLLSSANQFIAVVHSVDTLDTGVVVVYPAKAV